MKNLLPIAMLAVFSLALAPQAALAGEASESTTASPAASSAKPKLVCREIGTTGSRLKAKKVCATAAEWELSDRAAAKTTGKMAEIAGQKMNLEGPR